MNLREQIEKEITEKVMTKLASEKVELGAIQDLEKLQDETSKFFDRLDDALVNAKSELSQAISIGKKALPVAEKAYKLRQEVESLAEDLGMDLPKKITQVNVKYAKEVIESDLKKVETIYKNFKVK
tara:strand:+ start:144 stop:521 length:378 start_codon:yes stop_codon:yes gene_type:complete